MDKKPTFFDVLLISGIIALSLYLYIGPGFVYKTEVRTALVIVDGIKRQIDISKDGAVDIIDKFRVEVRSGRIRILSSDCPKQICKHAGWISRPGESLICVPSKIVITISGEERYDAVSR